MRRCGHLLRCSGRRLARGGLHGDRTVPCGCGAESPGQHSQGHSAGSLQRASDANTPGAESAAQPVNYKAQKVTYVQSFLGSLFVSLPQSTKPSLPCPLRPSRSRLHSGQCLCPSSDPDSTVGGGARVSRSPPSDLAHRRHPRPGPGRPVADAPPCEFVRCVSRGCRRSVLCACESLR